jgi:drug/metabolite transporter (DMT)-like permease
VLSWADFSFVQPATSIGYGMVAILGYFALGESISPTRWIGVMVICLGVLMIGQTPPRTTEPKLKSPIGVARIEEIG